MIYVVLFFALLATLSTYQAFRIMDDYKRLVEEAEYHHESYRQAYTELRRYREGSK